MRRAGAGLGSTGNLLAICVALWALVGISKSAAQTYEFPSTSNDPSGFSPSALGVESFQTDLFSGSTSTSIPIVVPPGTGGMQPSLALVYNSGNRKDTETTLAPGWSLSGLGYIEHSTRFGVPTYTSSDTYTLALNGTNELVYVSGDGRYHTKDESFLKIEFLSASDSWLVTDTSGTQYRFGGGTNSRSAAIGRSATRRWALDQVTDTHNNQMSISYINDTITGAIYPQTITYTQGNGLTTFRTVEFYYESRPDPVRRYRSSSKVELTQRLAYIDVKMNGAMVRRYELTYTNSTNAQNALLTTVQEFGADANPTSRGTGTALPATRYDYAPSPNNFSGGALPWLQQAAANAAVADFTGDGRADVAYCVVGELNFGHWYIAASTGSGFTVGDPVVLPNCFQFASVKDFNGDGRADLAIGDSSGVVVALSTGTQFSSSTVIWNGVADSGVVGSVKVFFQDMNGDGKTDVTASWITNTVPDPNWGYECTVAPCWRFGVSLWHDSIFGSEPGFHYVPGAPTFTTTYENAPSPVLWVNVVDLNSDGLGDAMRGLGGPDNKMEVRFSEGDHLGTPMTWFPANPPIDGGTDPLKLWRFGDFNGDGLLDFLVLETADPTHRRALVYTNTGADFIGPLLWLTAPGAWDTSDKLNVQVGDFNGDGKTDLVGYQASGTFWDVHLSSGKEGIDPGTGFSAPGSGNWVTASSGTYSPHFDDFDGDGKTDYAEYFKSASPYDLKVHLSAGPPIHAMTTITNGFGGTTSVAYEFLPIVVSGGLPFRIPVVSSLTYDDGMGHLTSTTYAYLNGKFDMPTREFRGFGEVTVTDPTGAYTKTTFLQTNELRGQPSQIEVYSATNAPYSKTVNTWQYDLFTGVPFQFLKQQDVYTHDGGETAKQTRTVYYYDDVGNVGKIDDLGDLSTTLDDRYHWADYHYITYSVHYRLPIWHATTPDSIGAYFGAETDYFYDNATVWYTPPTTGNLTKVCSVDIDSTDPCSTFGYDVFGNRTSATDPRGNTSTMVPDALYRTFPVTTTNALSQSVTTTYWGVNSPLSASSISGAYAVPGLVATVTDPNNLRMDSYWDALGRPKATVVPADTTAAPTTVYTYDRDGVAPEGVQTQQRETVGGGTLDAYGFVDGFGRTVQSKSEAPDGANQTVVDTTYNSRGLAETVSIPYLRPSTTTYTTPDTTVPKTTMLYDPVRRVSQVTNTDGTYASQSHDKWTTTLIDPNGRKRVETRDGFGQLVKVEEYLGSDGRAAPDIPAAPYTPYTSTPPTYAYDILGNLTQTTDALGNVTTMTYDTLSRKIAMHDPDLGDWSYGYDLAGNLTSQTDAKGQTITFMYDELNRIETKVVAGQTTTYNYDTALNGKGRLASVVDPTGGVSFAYDMRGNVYNTEKTIGLNTYITTTTYDSLNRLDELSYPDNETVSHTYDLAGNLKTVGSYVTDISYNALGQPLTMDFGNGTQTIYAYHPTHFRLDQLRTTGFAGSGSAATDLGFEGCTAVDGDPPGWSVSAAADTGCTGQPYQGSWSAYTLRSASLSQPITLVGGTTYTVSVYARAGTSQVATLQLSSAPGGGTTYCSPPGVTGLTWTLMTCSYTPSTTATAYLNLKATGTSTTNAAYFDLVRVTTGPAASNAGFESCTTVDVDPPGWTVSSAANTGCTTASKHSGAWSGQATASAYLSQAVTLTGGTTYTVSVYAMNSSTGQTATLQVSSSAGGGTTYCSPPATSLTVWTLLTCSYTPASTETAYLNLKAGTSGTVYARFDSLSIAAGPVTSNQGFEACTAAGADPPGWTVSNATNTGCTTTAPHTGAWQASARANAYLSQVVSVASGLQYTFSVYAMSASSGQTATLQVSSAAGGGTTYCSPPTTAATTWTLLTCEYTPAATGTAYVNLKSGASSTVYARFDTVSVTSVSAGGTSGSPVDVQHLSYTYDAAGNVKTIQDHLASAYSQSFEYDDLHRLKTATGNYGALTYRYNEIGNLLCNSQQGACSEASPNYTYPTSGATSVRPHAVTTAGSNSYTYDANGNMLTGAGRTFGYNAEDQPTSITVGGVTSTMSYDFSGARVTKAVGGSTTTYLGDLYECAATCTKYIFAGGTRVALKSAGTVLYYHPNHLSSTHVVTDASGVAAEEVQYSPYGATWSDTGSVGVTYKYTDQELDGQTGLYYYDARYYDPVLGRFTSADWIGFALRQPQTANRYSYVLNNPLRFTDPTGHEHIESIPADPENGRPNRTVIIHTTIYGDGPDEPPAPPAFSGPDTIAMHSDPLFLEQVRRELRRTPEPSLTSRNATCRVCDSWGREAGPPGGTGQNRLISNVSTKWVNPTGGLVRGCDNFGCGQFGASRGGITGPRLHTGTDFVANPGQNVMAVTGGTVTRIGYPYGDDLSYRYIQLETQTGYRVRELYVSPLRGIKVGSSVAAGQVVGTQQPLGPRYPGITEHVHVEIRRDGQVIDPVSLIPVR